VKGSNGDGRRGKLLGEGGHEKEGRKVKERR
jgi:hypothetical protein